MERNYFMELKEGKLTEEEVVNFNRIMMLQRAGVTLSAEDFLSQKEAFQEMWLNVKEVMELKNSALLAIAIGNTKQAEIIFKYLNANNMYDIVATMMGY